MKKVVSILLAVIFILSLSGCKNNEENTEDTSTSESTTEPTTEKIDYDNLVTDAYSGTKNDRKISIPKINLDSKEIDELNDEIWQDLYVNGVEGRDDISSTNSGDYISYKWYVNDDIISIIITDGTEHEIWYSYIVYNISIENKNIVDNETVITGAGLTMDEYYDKAKDAIGSEFFNKYGQFMEEMSGYEDTANDYNEALSNSISKENIDSAFPYLNENGELCIIAPIYSISQMDITSHETDLNLENFELVEGYDEKAVFAEESVQTEPEVNYTESVQVQENSEPSTVSFDDYFNGDVDGAIKKMKSLVGSVADTTIKVGNYNNTPDGNVSWSILYNLLNIYEVSTPSSENVPHETGAAVKVQSNDLLNLYNECFSNKISSLPAIGSEYAGGNNIEYLAEEDAYTFARATGGGYVAEFKNGYMLDNGNAMLVFSVKDYGNSYKGDCYIEVETDSSSRFGYTVVSSSRG